MRLTNAIREGIAQKAVKELFIQQLLKQFDEVKENIIVLAKEAYRDFDYKKAEPYRQYIHWHKKICISRVSSDWDSIQWDDFRRNNDLPQVYAFELPFEIPSNRDEYSSVYFTGEYNKRAIEILRPYMTMYFRARDAYSSIKTSLVCINTEKQLEEVLPELVKYLPKTTIDGVTALVPQEQINKVKALFGGNRGGKNA